MNDRSHQQVFRPASADVIRGSVSCLKAGVVAGTLVALGLFLLTTLALWLTRV